MGFVTSPRIQLTNDEYVPVNKIESDSSNDTYRRLSRVACAMRTKRVAKFVRMAHATSVAISVDVPWCVGMERYYARSPNSASPPVRSLG